jgi:hypothetical protein
MQASSCLSSELSAFVNPTALADLAPPAYGLHQKEYVSTSRQVWLERRRNRLASASGTISHTVIDQEGRVILNPVRGALATDATDYMGWVVVELLPAGVP